MSEVRTTTLGISDSILGYIKKSESKYYQLSEQAASGYKVSTPSDDPEATESLLNIQATLNQLNGYIANMKSAQTDLNNLDDNLATVTDLITKATDLATEAANGTYSTTDMDNIKTQVDQVIKSVVDVANSKYDGSYLFSGAKASTQPYTVAADGSVTYNGTPSTGEYQKYVTISDGVTVSTNTTGDQVFGSYTASVTGPPAVPASGSGLLLTLGQLSEALGKHDQTAVSATLTGLSTALDNVSAIRTKFAAVSNRFEITDTSINSAITNLKSSQSDLQDVDLSKVLAELATQQTALQASYGIFSKVNGMSLLDYIQ